MKFICILILVSITSIMCFRYFDHNKTYERGFTAGLKFAIKPLHDATKDTNHIYKISVVEKDTISITVFSSKKIKKETIKTK